MSKPAYYRELFSTQYGFDVDRAVLTDTSYPAEGLHSYTLVLTSELDPKQSINFRNNVIVVCDVPYVTTHPHEFSCDTKIVASEELDLISGLARSVETNNSILYVIPEDVLANPSQRERLSHIFSAIRSSDSAVNTAQIGTVEENDENIEVSLSIYSSILKLLISLILLSLLLWVFSLGNKSGFQKQFGHKIKEIIRCCSKFTYYLVVPFGVLLVMYLPLILVLNVRDSQRHNPFYAISYFIDTLDPKIFIYALENNNYYRLLFFFYTLLLINILILILLPTIVSAWRFARKSVVGVEFKNFVYKYAIPLLVFVELVLVNSRVHEKFIFLPMFILATLLILLFIALKQEKSVVYSRKDKFVVVIALCTLLVGYYAFKISIDKGHLSLNTENLINSSDSIVTLPLKVIVSDNTRFNEYLVSKSYPIYANDYLIYAPDYPEIWNKPLNEFVETGDYYIHGSSIEDKIKALNKTPSVIELLESITPTSFFRVTNSNYNALANDIYLTLDIYCSEPRLITATHYYGEGEILSTKVSDLLYFPGCKKGFDSQSYTVNINYPITTDAYLYTKLNNIKDSELRALRIDNKVMMDDMRYISNAGPYSVLKSHVINNFTQPITNYYIGTIPPYNFNTPSDSNGRVNIAEPLNKLLSDKQFENSFILWTPKTYEIFRSSLD